MRAVQIGGRAVGPGHPAMAVAEIGINHNGDMAITKRLMDVAKAAGCELVKFQKRTVDVVYTPDELAKPRTNPFGDTNGDLKRGLEFGEAQYHEIDTYAKALGLGWYASCWDEASVDFIEQFSPPAYKIASASLTDDDLLAKTRSTGRPIVLATGMSTLAQVDHAVQVLGTENLILLHTVSTYPAAYPELNLRVVQTLATRYEVPVGYSGHETGIASTVAAVALGACMIERHITLDRAMWGSDHAASLEPNGLAKLIRDIRLVELALGSPEKGRLDSEVPMMQKLRRVG